MVSEPNAPESARVDAPDFSKTSTSYLLEKVARVVRNNQRHRADATRSWILFYLPAVRDLHAAKAARVGGVLEGMKIEDEELLGLFREQAERRVAVHAEGIKRELEFVPINCEWLRSAMEELQKRRAA